MNTVDIVKEGSNSRHSRLVSWSVENFMCIEKGECSFDDRNIINIKGYNDSGKSTMMLALNVALNNRYASQQLNFIQDDKSYFRIMVYFDDGVLLVRDKYLNGQGLYALYKGNTEVFSTLQNGVYTKITEVPEIIRDYLDMVNTDDFSLNFRACFEKQLLVQTSGSENYRLLNEVLKSEEISLASAQLNTDKNILVSRKHDLESKVYVMRNSIAGIPDISDTLIDKLKISDKNIDIHDEMSAFLQETGSILKERNEIVEYPSIHSIDIGQIDNLLNIQDLTKGLDTEIHNELPLIDINKLSDILNLSSISEDINKVQVHTHIDELDSTELSELSVINNLLNDIKDCKVYKPLEQIGVSKLSDITKASNYCSNIKECDSIDKDISMRLETLKMELDNYNKELESIGVHLVKCPSCGMIFDGEHHHAE